MSHTKEPWIVKGTTIRTAGAGIDAIATMQVSNRPFWDEDARRIVACVNACAGIGTGDLERYYNTGGGIDAAMEEASLRDQVNVLQQRDKLLAALETFTDWYDERSGDGECRPLENARAAIASVKGGA